MSAALTSRGASVVSALLVWGLFALPAPASAQSWSPSITWNTYVGGSADDTVEDLVTDSKGNLFVVGETKSSAGFPLATGLPDAVSKQDVFVSKYDAATGALRWSVVFGGGDDDSVSQVRLVPDDSGDLYVLGTLKASTSGIRTTPNATTFSTLNAYQGGASDAFLARVSSSGVLSWLLFVGGDGEDQGLALAVNANSTYVAGMVKGGTTFTGSSVVGNRGAGFDAFVSQVSVPNPDQPIAGWTRTLASSGDDAVYGLALNGNTLYAGGTMKAGLGATDLVVVAAFHGGNSDGFVTRLDSQGRVAWFAHVGSSDEDEVRALLPMPDSEDVALVGHTNSPTYRTSQSSGTDFDVFVSRMTSEGGLVGTEGVRVGGDDNEKAYSHAGVDAFGNIYVGGRTASPSKLAKNAFDPIFETNNGSVSDGFVAMVDPSAQQVIWASYVGGRAIKDEYVIAFAADRDGWLILGGYSDAINLPFDLAAPGQDKNPNGGLDGFLFRLQVDGSPPQAGEVVGSLSGGTFSATWGGFPDAARNFSDTETGIVSYTWGIGTSPGSDDVRAFQKVPGTKTYDSVSDVQAEPGKIYYVTVTATNAVGLETQVSSKGFSVAGPVDPGTDGGTGPEPQPEPQPEPVPGGELLSPVGWGCGSTGGGGAAGALALVALGLLTLRRARAP